MRYEDAQGYTNWVTFHTAVMIDNERPLHEQVQRIVRGEAGNARAAAPKIKRYITSVLSTPSAGELTAAEREMWHGEIQAHGGLAEVDWEDIAESEAEDVLSPKDWGFSRRRGGWFAGRSWSGRA